MRHHSAVKHSNNNNKSNRQSRNCIVDRLTPIPRLHEARPNGCGHRFDGLEWVQFPESNVLNQANKYIII